MNKITVKNKYPLSRIEDMLDQLQRVNYVSKINLKFGYHQVQIGEEDTWKTAFKMRQGLFEWMVMSFGLTNASTMFMRLMNEVLRPYLDSFLVVYLDDILIYKKIWEDHLKNTKIVLEVLKKEQLQANLKKCTFVKNEIIYLGFKVDGAGLKIDLAKTEIILKWPVPKNLHELRSFMGLANYLRIFFVGYSEIALPLNALIKGNTTFIWIERQQRSFDELKHRFCNALVLALPDIRLPLRLKKMH